uniref:WPP domain-containing protein n=1 Tax=Vitis vinifera TaxID=29760 RepID=A5B1H9_VITVI|nr:hypothetical protein VITISV_013893 [Vitis vinifera]
MDKNTVSSFGSRKGTLRKEALDKELNSMVKYGLRLGILKGELFSIYLSNQGNDGMTIPDLSRCVHISKLNLADTTEELELPIFSYDSGNTDDDFKNSRKYSSNDDFDSDLGTFNLEKISGGVEKDQELNVGAVVRDTVIVDNQDGTKGDACTDKSETAGLSNNEEKQETETKPEADSQATKNEHVIKGAELENAVSGKSESLEFADLNPVLNTTIKLDEINHYSDEMIKKNAELHSVYSVLNLMKMGRTSSDSDGPNQILFTSIEELDYALVHLGEEEDALMPDARLSSISPTLARVPEAIEKYAKDIEDAAFAIVNQHHEKEPDGDGSSAVQPYAKESSKLMLEILKQAAMLSTRSPVDANMGISPPNTHKPPSTLIPYDVDLGHPRTPSAVENTFNGNAEVHAQD